MTNVTISHIWTRNPNQDPDILSASPVTIGPRQYMQFTINVGPGGNDLWGLAFTWNNYPWKQGAKQCDVKEADATSLFNQVKVNLRIMNARVQPPFGLIGTGVFDIVMPASDSCLTNSMEQG
jgi:hypothetical protein